MIRRATGRQRVRALGAVVALSLVASSFAAWAGATDDVVPASVDVTVTPTAVAPGGEVSFTTACAAAPSATLIAADATVVAEGPSPLIVPAGTAPGTYTLRVSCDVDGDGVVDEGTADVGVVVPPPADTPSPDPPNTPPPLLGPDPASGGPEVRFQSLDASAPGPQASGAVSALAGTEFPFPAPACPADQDDEGGVFDGVGYTPPQLPCLFSNSMDQGTWGHQFATGATASPSVVTVGSDNTVDLTLSLSTSFSRHYSPPSLPAGTYEMSPTWRTSLPTAVIYADADGRYYLPHQAGFWWTNTRLGTSCNAPNDGPIGPITNAGSCTYRFVDTSVAGFAGHQALLLVGIPYGIGVRHTPAEPVVSTMKYVDGPVGPYSTAGGSTPNGNAWVVVKLLGSGSNQPPAASFTQTPSGAGPGSIHFVSASTDPDGDALNQVWDYGDGSPTEGGPNRVHQYTTPGTYTAKLTVTDVHGATSVTQQQVIVAAPTLGVAISYPGHASGQFASGEEFTARVTVSASAGVGDLSNLEFVGAPLSVSAGADVVELAASPAISTPFSLAPGTSRPFDFTMRATGEGEFTLRSVVKGRDAAGTAVGPEPAQRNGVVSPLVVELESRGDGIDAIELVMTVSNAGDRPITDMTYEGTGGITLRPELLPEQLRGGVRLTSGPDPGFPSVLQAGETRRATFRFEGTDDGTVVVIGQARGTSASGSPVNGAAPGSLEVEGMGTKADRPTSMNKHDIAAFLAANWEDAVRRDAAASRRMHEAARDAILQRLQTVEDTDQIRLIATAFGGLLEGGTDAFVGLYDLGEQGVMYVGDALDRGGPFQLWIDAAYLVLDGVEGAHGYADSAVAGLANELAGEWYSQEDRSTQYVPLPGPQLDGTVADAMVKYAEGTAAWQVEAQAKVDAADAEITNAINAFGEGIQADRYEWARNLTRTVGKAETELLVADLATRGGLKLLGKALEAAKPAAQSEALLAARRLVANSGQLEALGEDAALTVEQLRKLGGITAKDATVIDEIIVAGQKEFGVELELQARPSNPYSVALYESAEGAVGKTEILKVKSLTDVDVILGADPRSAGKVGVFKPTMPGDDVWRELTPALRKEVEARFETQQKNWTAWNDPTSELSKNFELASQDGGYGNFEFTAPGKDGVTRKGFLEARKVDDYEVGQTVTFQSKPRGGEAFVDIGSDIDWQATLQVVGDSTKVANRDRIHLWLNDQFRRRGLPFGEHGVTVNAFDFKGAGIQYKASKAWLSFILESLPAEQAAELAEVWARRLQISDPSGTAGMTVDQLKADILDGVVTGKFVIKFRAGSVRAGSTAVPS